MDEKAMGNPTDRELVDAITIVAEMDVEPLEQRPRIECSIKCL